MSLEDAKHQKAKQMALPLEVEGETRDDRRSGEASTAMNGIARLGTNRLMEETVGTANVEMALKQVRRNKGSPGVDGMTVDELPQYVAAHWEELRAQLLTGTYQPKSVKRQEIDKEGGGVRILGIPCALDRFIQQIISEKGSTSPFAASRSNRRTMAHNIALNSRRPSESGSVAAAVQAWRWPIYGLSALAVHRMPFDPVGDSGNVGVL